MCGCGRRIAEEELRGSERDLRENEGFEGEELHAILSWQKEERERGEGRGGVVSYA